MLINKILLNAYHKLEPGIGLSVVKVLLKPMN